MQAKPLLIPALFYFCFSTSALACICSVPASPCEWYASSHGHPTFVGVAVSDVTEPDVLKLGNRALPVTVHKVQFRVEEPFEDIPAEFVDIYGSGTTCDYHFRVGTRYLVYGFRDRDGRIRTGKCTRTAPLSDATEDLKFLRSLPTRIGGGILGTVRFVNPQHQTGTIAGTVTASGSDGDHKARVAVSGNYELNGLAIGEYRLTFTPDDNSTEHVQFKVRIPVTGSCAGTGVRLGNTTVSGAVIDAAGSPISGADVLLFYALDGNFHPEVALKTLTDANGRFTFHRVEAAKFILSAQLAASKMTFFPATHDSSKTKIVEVPDGTPLSGLTVRVLSR